jgi:hypothetical protein
MTIMMDKTLELCDYCDTSYDIRSISSCELVSPKKKTCELVQICPGDFDCSAAHLFLHFFACYDSLGTYTSVNNLIFHLVILFFPSSLHRNPTGVIMLSWNFRTSFFGRLV